VAGRGDQPSSGRSVYEARLFPPLAEPPDQVHAIQLKIFRRRVKEDWVDGVLKQSLFNGVLVSIGKREVNYAVEAPWKYNAWASDTTDSPLDYQDVSAIYDINYKRAVCVGVLQQR
jgi:hypothetical protein